MTKNIYVTRPALPSLTTFSAHVGELWQSGALTNGGVFHQQLELALAEFLEVPYVSLFDNGTSALISALSVLDLTGEVITTPYSFIATSHALLWNQLTPVFVDIDPASGNLDATQVSAAITERTSAILAVHCYGIPCDTAALATIAKQHQLKLVYDAAHAFAVRDAQGSILKHGDLAALSFHATKVFSTCEGGALISHSKDMKARIDRHKNFGIESEEKINGVGLNGKMSELHAAFGLSLLPEMPALLERRKSIFQLYAKELSALPYIALMLPGADIEWNQAYVPIIVDQSGPVSRDQLYEQLKHQQIFSRKYFYPLITNTATYANCIGAAALPNAQKLSNTVLCLPIYPALADEDVISICNAIKAIYA